MSVEVSDDADDGDFLNSTASAESKNDSESTRVEDDDDDDDDDITLDVRDSEDPVQPDDTFSYIIRITNNDSSSKRIDVTGFLDDNTEFISASDSGRETNNDEEVEWDNISISGDSSKTLTVHVRVTDDAEDGDTLRFRVRAEDEEQTELTEVEDDDDD